MRFLSRRELFSLGASFLAGFGLKKSGVIRRITAATDRSFEITSEPGYWYLSMSSPGRLLQGLADYEKDRAERMEWAVWAFLRHLRGKPIVTEATQVSWVGPVPRRAGICSHADLVNGVVTLELRQEPTVIQWAGTRRLHGPVVIIPGVASPHYREERA